MPKGEEVEKENKPPRRRPKGDAVARAKAKAKAKAKAAAAKPDEPEESKPNKRAKRWVMISCWFPRNNLKQTIRW